MKIMFCLKRIFSFLPKVLSIFRSQIVSIGLGDPIRNERLNFQCFSCNFQPWKWGNNILCKDWVRHAHNEKVDHVNLYCSECSKWFLSKSHLYLKNLGGCASFEIHLYGSIYIKSGIDWNLLTWAAADI